MSPFHSRSRQLAEVEDVGEPGSAEFVLIIIKPDILHTFGTFFCYALFQFGPSLVEFFLFECSQAKIGKACHKGVPRLQIHSSQCSILSFFLGSESPFMVFSHIFLNMPVAKKMGNIREHITHSFAIALSASVTIASGSRIRPKSKIACKIQVRSSSVAVRIQQ